MVYSPDQVKLKYVVLFNMKGDSRWKKSINIQIEEVALPSYPKEGKSARCSSFGALTHNSGFIRWPCFTVSLLHKRF